MKLSQKLGAFCAIVTALPLLIISAFALSAFSSYSDTQATEQLKKDGRAAAAIYEKRLDELRAAAQQLATAVANKALVSSDTASQDSTSAWARLQDMLPRTQNEFNLDFLIVADPSGRVIARHNDKPAPGELVTSSPVVAASPASSADPENKNLLAERVITEGLQLRDAAVAAAAVEQGEKLKRLGLDQLAQVRDGSAVKTEKALMLEACAPIFSGGRFIGIVLIGQMLNNYSEGRSGATSIQTPVIAQAHRQIYPGANTDSGVVVSLGDVIIASSIFSMSASDRPVLLGEPHKPEQTEEQLTQKSLTYRLSWQPIKTLDGVAVGHIGAALSEDNIGGANAALKITLLIITLIAALSAGAAGFFVGRNLATRIEMLTEAANRMSLGELSAPIRDDAFSEGRKFSEFFLDEINQLTYQLDEMRESFRQAVDRLRKR